MSTQAPQRSEIRYEEALPDAEALAAESLLIYDERLATLRDSALPDWLSRFPLRYSVVAGEALKDLAAFPGHVEKLSRLCAQLAPARMSVIAVGGGSVGDFAGFFASVWKRGVQLLQIPSTWLAAIDSAHGGKNALNVGAVKNQLGTFYFARRIHLCRLLLCAQPEERAREAFGELAKIAILDENSSHNVSWVDALTQSPLSGSELLWRFLPDAVSAKYRIVDVDPFERTGLRQRLNLGHTVGHVIETVHGLPHGIAVAQGLRFALKYSERRGFLTPDAHAQIGDWLSARFALHDRKEQLPRIAAQRFVDVIGQDKKRADSDQINFVFIRGRGQITIEKVRVAELLAEAIDQGYATPN